MAPKKKIELVEETPNAVSPSHEVALYATADFEIKSLGIVVKEGELFVPPHGWERNQNQQEFLLASKAKQGTPVGMAFSYQGEVVNPGEKTPELRERRVHTAILPLIER